MPRLAALLIFLALVLSAGTVRADDHWPPAAEARFQQALQLALKGKHLEAAQVYREVVEWPEGGEFKERARALYAAAEQLEVAKDLDRALAAYRELVTRFPRSDFVSIANRAAERIAPSGVQGGIDFERRHREATDVLLPAMTAHYRRDFEKARPLLERALALLLALLKDHRDHPKAVDVAVAISDVYVRLERLDEALAYAQEALALAHREADKPGAPNTAQGDVINARRQLAEATTAIHARRLDLASRALLLLLALVLLARKPWAVVTRRMAVLWLKLLALDGVLAIVGAVAAEYVKRRENLTDSTLTDPIAALLVFAPGVVGTTVALGFTFSFKGRRSSLLAAAAAVAAALAASIILVQHFGFFTALIPEL
jgi:tetratricopeptide (TPR) repeat protein